MQSKYLSAAETAKLVRTALKAAFPRTKFSVRSRTYSMGASIDVVWTDGPCDAAVQRITSQYKGAEFDGMIDLKTHKSHWLLPDGTTVVASDAGTVGYGGSNPAERNWMPNPEAKLVHFGADYVFTQRHITRSLLERAVARLAHRGYPVETVQIVGGEHAAYVEEKRPVDREAMRGFDMVREVNNAARRTHCA
jgi:hypothetical protein